MGFLSPKVPTPPPAPNTPIAANAGMTGDPSSASGLASLISTGGSGLRRKAATNKTSLVGGS